MKTRSVKLFACVAALAVVLAVAAPSNAQAPGPGMGNSKVRFTPIKSGFRRAGTNFSSGFSPRFGIRTSGVKSPIKKVPVVVSTTHYHKPVNFTRKSGAAGRTSSFAKSRVVFKGVTSTGLFRADAHKRDQR